MLVPNIIQIISSFLNLLTETPNSTDCTPTPVTATPASSSVPSRPANIILTVPIIKADSCITTEAQDRHHRLLHSHAATRLTRSHCGPCRFNSLSHASEASSSTLLSSGSVVPPMLCYEELNHFVASLNGNVVGCMIIPLIKIW